jgi:hypothetical protein
MEVEILLGAFRRLKKIENGQPGPIFGGERLKKSALFRADLCNERNYFDNSTKYL